MDLTDELARLQRRMDELQAETDRLTAELERLGRKLEPGTDGESLSPDGLRPPEERRTV